MIEIQPVVQPAGESLAPGRLRHDDIEVPMGALLSVCDGANAKDGQGYSGVDSMFARSLWEQRERGWTLPQATAAARVLGRYAGQLGRMGLTVPPPEVVRDRYAHAQTPDASSETRPLVRVVRNDSNIVVWFAGYLPSELEAFKAQVVSARRFDPAPPRWIVQPTQANARGLLALAGRRGWEMASHVQAFLMGESEKAARRLEQMPDGKIRVVMEYAPGVKSTLEKNGIIQWDEKNGRTILSPVVGGAEAVTAREILHAHEFVIPPEVLSAWERDEEVAVARVEASKAPHADPFAIPGLKAGVEIRPFQYAGIRYALDTLRAGAGVLIADEMGLGKTVQGICVAQMVGAKKVLVACPTSLVYNWRAEIGKFVGQSAAILTGTKPPSSWKPVARWTVIGYSVLHAWADKLIESGFDLVIFDEAHYLKSNTSRRGKAARKVSKGIGHERTVALTGTPSMNNAMETWTLGRLCGQEESLGGFKHFTSKYAVRDSWGVTNEATEAVMDGTLNTRLREVFMVRRLKEDVLKELPNKLPAAHVYLDIDNRDEYEIAEAELVNWIENHAKPPAGLSEDGIKEWRSGKASAARQAEQLVRMTALQVLASHGKRQNVCRWLKDFTSGGTPAIVAAKYIEDQKALVAAFPHAAFALGEHKPEQRQAAVDAFQSGKTDLIIVSLMAMGVGWTGTRAQDVVLTGFPWRPGDIDQMIDRAHRIGQTKEVTPWYLIADRTIEEDILAVIAKKRRVTSAVSDGVIRAEDMGAVVDEIGKRLLERAGRASAN